MKKNTLLFMLLAALVMLISSCDNGIPTAGRDDGDNSGDNGTGPRRSLTNIAIQVTDTDSKTLNFYFKEPVGTVTIAIENSNGELLAQREVDTNQTALTEIDITEIGTTDLTIKITDTRNHLIYQEVYNLE